VAQALLPVFHSGFSSRPQVATDPQRRTFQTYPERLLSVNVDFLGNPGRISFINSYFL
jgi:hypothetical protein